MSPWRGSRCCARPKKSSSPPWWRAACALIVQAHQLPADGLKYLARNREARVTHINGNLPRPADPRGRPDPHAFTAQQKLIDARSLEEALEWFTLIERVEVAERSRLLNQLAMLPDAPRHTFLI